MATIFKNIKKSRLEVNQSTEGETIEAKVRRIVNNKEPIKDGAPLIYTDRKDGVLPGYNIKTDRWETAVEATDKVTKSILATRENKPTLNVVKEDGEPESVQGTDSK